MPILPLFGSESVPDALLGVDRGLIGPSVFLWVPCGWYTLVSKPILRSCARASWVL